MASFSAGPMEHFDLTPLPFFCLCYQIVIVIPMVAYSRQAATEGEIFNVKDSLRKGYLMEFRQFAKVGDWKVGRGASEANPVLTGNCAILRDRCHLPDCGLQIRCFDSRDIR